MITSISPSGITTFFKFILFSINKVLLACYANFILLLIHVLTWLPYLAPLSYLYIYIYIYFFLFGYENNSSFDNFFCMHKLVHRWRIRLQVLQEFDHTQINLWRYILVQYFSYLWISLPACLFLFCIVPPPFRIGNMMT